VPEAATGSFAGGLAVAYVFLHLLPEITEGNESNRRGVVGCRAPHPVAGPGNLRGGAVGFTAFLALERLADRHAPRPGALPDATARLIRGRRRASTVCTSAPS
jgi:hypothetical protein